MLIFFWLFISALSVMTFRIWFWTPQNFSKFRKKFKVFSVLAPVTFTLNFKTACFFFLVDLIKFFISFDIFRVINKIWSTFKSFWFISELKFFQFSYFPQYLFKSEWNFFCFIFKVFPTKLWIYYIILV